MESSKDRFRWRTIIIAVLFLVLVAGGGIIYWQYRANASGNGPSGKTMNSQARILHDKSELNEAYSRLKTDADRKGFTYYMNNLDYAYKQFSQEGTDVGKASNLATLARVSKEFNWWLARKEFKESPTIHGDFDNLNSMLSDKALFAVSVIKSVNSTKTDPVYPDNSAPESPAKVSNEPELALPSTAPKSLVETKPHKTPPAKAAVGAVRGGAKAAAQAPAAKTPEQVKSMSAADAEKVVSRYTEAVNNYGRVREELAKINDPELKRQIAVLDNQLALVLKQGTDVAVSPVVTMAQIIKYSTTAGYKDRLGGAAAAFGIMYDNVASLSSQAGTIVEALNKKSDNADFKAAIKICGDRVPTPTVPATPTTTAGTTSNTSNTSGTSVVYSTDGTATVTSGIAAITEPETTDAAAGADRAAAVAADVASTSVGTTAATIVQPSAASSALVIIPTIMDLRKDQAISALDEVFNYLGLGENETIFSRYTDQTTTSDAKAWLAYQTKGVLESIAPEQADILLEMLVSLNRQEAVVVLKSIADKDGYVGLSETDQAVYNTAMEKFEGHLQDISVSVDAMLTTGKIVPKTVVGTEALTDQEIAEGALWQDLVAAGLEVNESNIGIYQAMAESMRDTASCNEVCAGMMASLLANGQYDRYQAIYNHFLGVSILDIKGKDDTETIRNAVNAMRSSITTDDFMKQVYRASISISPVTGKLEYFTFIKRQVCSVKYENTDQVIDECYDTIGYVSLDPSTGKSSAKVPFKFGKQNATFYSNPSTGDMYVEFSGNKVDSAGNLKPLVDAGKIFAMESYTVSQDGSYGGTFKSFGKVFKYNSNTKAFEIPIKVSKAGSFNGFVSLDSKGNISGNLVLGNSKTGTANLYFDRAGNIVLSKSIDIHGNSLIGADGKTTPNKIGSFSVTSEGDIAGTINLTAVFNDPSVKDVLGMKDGLGIKSPVNLTFSRKGLEGISFDIGSVSGLPISASVNFKSGALAFSGFVLVGPVPVPLSLGQDASGNFILSWPGGKVNVSKYRWMTGPLGQMFFGKNETRPLNAPQLEATSDGEYDASSIYFRHSFKKIFMTVRVYQVPPESIDLDEQIERSNMIFEVFNEKLGRNPGVKDFFNWYFYSGHELYKYPDHNQKDYRMKATKEKLEWVIANNSSKVVPSYYKTTNKREFACVAKYGRAKCRIPNDTMDSNPFDVGESGVVDMAGLDDNTLKEFLAGVTANMGDIPYDFDNLETSEEYLEE